MQSEQYVHASDSYAIESSSNTSLADMPPEVRACVLRHLPVGMRLGPCALTCSALSAAAVAATDVLCMHSIYQQKASALAAWIAKHGATLVHLELKDCTAVNFDCGMGHLASLTALQRLELQAAFNNAYAALGGEAAYGAALSSTTGQLQQLTALELSTLHRHSLPAYALAGLSKLTRLRQLKLHCFRSAAKPVSLQGLPSSVTQLHLSDTAATVSDALGSSSGKPLPDLQDLQLEMCAVIEVAAVAHFSHLKRLSCVGGSRFTTPELLAVLPRLQQLQVLSLDSFDDDDAVTAADYAALTASSNLVSLQLVCCSIPQAALQHMFAPGRRLPHLRCLNVSLAGGGEPVTPCWWVSDALLMDNLLFTPGDAQRLVECCPALQELGCVTLCHGASSSLLVPLLQLSKLTSLLIGGTMCGDAEAAKLLAKFTGALASSGQPPVSSQCRLTGHTVPKHVLQITCECLVSDPRRVLMHPAWCLQRHHAQQPHADFVLRLLGAT
jgi:hypothetical protein